MVRGACWWGSSPLTRGKLCVDRCTASVNRLIPAHAGKTYPETRQSQVQWAHPRSRGENRTLWPGNHVGVGSSPLTRGKHDVSDRRLTRGGLIPAHAGKTVAAMAVILSGAAHPRSRGENVVEEVLIETAPGSSPLTRGKLPASARNTLPARLIPAHAGKTTARGRPIRLNAAHPRSRGENGLARLLTRRGSSPLTRGKRSGSSSGGGSSGLIPAHAGKTSNCITLDNNDSAHPRSRGENDPRVIRKTPDLGSSPLTRGKRSLASMLATRCRLIPAHAGKTRGA